MPKLRMMAPGPTQMPPEVVTAMTETMEHHRTPAFRTLLSRIEDNLRYLFQTQGDCLMVTGSGSAGMEAAIVSTCRPGEKALVVRNGKFAERWAEVCQTYGIPVVPLDLEWGHGAKADRIAAMLDTDPDIRSVIVTHSETSTAAVSDVEDIAYAVRARPDVLLLIDGITSVGAIPVKMDEWGVDVAVVGSQKALMTPPGLCLVAVGKRAWARAETFEPASVYLNLKAYRKSMATHDTPFTPATLLAMALDKALEIIRKEGMEEIWRRTAAFARATRSAVQAMGLKVFAADPVDSLTAIAFPDSIDASAIQKQLRQRMGIVVAGGQGPLKGRIIRANHMGYVDETDTLAFIAALELLSKEAGHEFELGAGTAAAIGAL